MWGLLNQISTVCTCADGLWILCCLVNEKIEVKVLASMHESLTNYKYPYWDPLQNSYCGIEEAACDLEK